MGSNRFWHIVSVVKEQLASLSSRVASNEPIKNSIPPKFVNSPFTSFFLFHKIPQPLRNPMNHSGFFRYARNFAHADVVRPAARKTKEPPRDSCDRSSFRTDSPLAPFPTRAFVVLYLSARTAD